MAIKRKNANNEWIVDQRATETSIIDIGGHFESNNVEGALRELAESQANNEELQSLTQRMNTAEEDIEWLKANGGGGGGGSTAVPTITSVFENTAVEKGQDVNIPIFFSSPNMGSGTAYILVNNLQVDAVGVSQGNNVIKIKAEYLASKTENLVGIYVKDRAGLVSNQLTWTIISGGIELTTTFDYEADYGITDTIRIPYNIETGITSEDIILHLFIDGIETQYTSDNGYNYIEITASNLGLGTHSVSMYATVSKYTSRTIVFNLVIVSTTELYLSSTFVNGTQFNYGVPIQINYRLSKISTEEFIVYLKIDGVTSKTQNVTVGSYYWTIQSLPIGEHTITIQAVSLDYTEEKSLTLNLEVVQGEYVPITAYELGLICDLNAVGKSNSDTNSSDWIDATGNGHNGKLINFNYGTNGFINDELVCDNDAYVVIPWSPWEDNAINGSTIDLIYTPINSGIENCRVIDYTKITDDLSTDEIKPFKGVFADVLMAIGSSASSGSNAGKVNLDDENGEIHLVWVLDRTNKFMKTYINGVLSRIMFLSDSGVGVNKFYEDFSHDEYIYLNSTKGQNCGTNNIKRFRVYDHALTSDQVLQNYLANITDLEEQEEVYNFNYRNNTLPKMYLTGDTTNMTDKQSVPMKIEYVSSNEEKFGASFNTGIQNNQVLIQGTSSLQYVRKNYTIYLKDEYGADMLYNPYGNKGVPENVFCLKADYMESSHANNTGVAKFINDCLYDTKTPPQLANSSCRTTINGFPIELYVNGEYMGVYNFNYDRYSYRPYGYDYTKYPRMLSYEINSNSNVSAGAFYRYGDNAESSANITELDYYKRDFNLIYGNRTTDSDTYSEIKELVNWVSASGQDLFRETISEHFNKEYLLRYYLMVLFIGAVDSLGKNLKLNTWDGRIWYPTFYDLDTVLGIDNSGYLTIGSDVEIEEGSYNTSNSNLWTKVWNYFNAELKEEWAKMRQDRFTLDNLMSYIYSEQISKIPAKLYNDDAQVKYLEFGSLYTYCCHGSKEHQIRRWLRERIAYVDSMMGYFTSQDDQVTIRMNKTGYVSFDITPYIPLYLSVKWSNASNGTQTIKVGRGETATFYYNSTTATDQEILIPYAKHIKRLDNLSNLNPSSCILSNAVKLTNVEIHSSELYNINVTNNRFLRRIDLQDCTALGTVTATGSSLDLSNCKYLQYCNTYNTNLTEIQLNTSGGSLIEIYYPKTIQSIQLIKQRLLETIGLPYGVDGAEIPTSLYTIDIEDCPNIIKLNTAEEESIYTTFASMIYCNNLTLRNSLDLKELSFDIFHRLTKVTIENMYNLESIRFNNLLPKGNVSTIKYIGMSNCPLLTEMELNCTSDDYEITFATDSILNLGKLTSLKNITSNCIIKGLKTIVVPLSLESMYFTNEYGEGYSTIKNIWSSSVCTVNTDGATAKVTHVDNAYVGIDFKNMNLKNIDLSALVNIPKAINFSLSPTTVNPNFNLNRDGIDYPYLQPIGTLDLSGYTESLARFFNGVDLDKLEIICNNDLPQTDLSYCFYNSTFSTLDNIRNLLAKTSVVNKLDYCFYKTSVDNVDDILREITWGSNTTMNYMFAECSSLKTISSLVIPTTVSSAKGMFGSSALTTVSGNIKAKIIDSMFENCKRLRTANLTLYNTTSMNNMFKNCILLEEDILIPSTVTSVIEGFSGCITMYNVHTNWNNSYNSQITATDCYKGCTSITQFDGVDIVLGEYDTSALEMIPTEWGGYGFLVEYTSIYKVNIPTDNYELVLGEMVGDQFISWGDGNITKSVDTHTYATSGEYIIKAMAYLNPEDWTPSDSIRETLIEIVKHFNPNGRSMKHYLNGYTSLRKIHFSDCILSVTNIFITDSTNKLSEATYDNCIFQDGFSTEGKLALYTEGNIYFNNCTFKGDCTSYFSNNKANIIGLNSINIDEVTNMSYMFKNNTALNSIDLSSWNIPSRVTDIGGMFFACSNLTSVNLSTWDTSNIKIMSHLFRDCKLLTDIKLSENFGINATNMEHMFNGITGATSIDLTNLNTSSAKNVASMFWGCSSLISLDLSNLDFSKATNMNSMLTNCTSLATLQNFIIGDNVTDITNMFMGCRKLSNIKNITLGKGITIGSLISPTSTSIATDNNLIIENIILKNNVVKFKNFTAIKEIKNLTITSDVTSLSEMFSNCKNLRKVIFTLDTDLSNVKNMAHMFSSCSNLTEINIGEVL